MTKVLMNYDEFNVIPVLLMIYIYPEQSSEQCPFRAVPVQPSAR